MASWAAHLAPFDAPRPALDFPHRQVLGRSEVSAATVLESPRPEIRSEPAERLGREGMVTVWDEHGRIVGCMGIELWRALLAARVEL